MIFPNREVLRRPGLLIPVFFLSACGGLAQNAGLLDAGSAALGGCYTCCLSGPVAALNQAGLGATEFSSLHLNHSRPFVSRELGITTMGLHRGIGNGGLGLSLSHMGIRGMQQSSLWIACGLRAGKSLRLGAGIHLLATGINGNLFHRVGTGCALGFQYSVNEDLELGCHLSLPLYRTRARELPPDILILATGMSYSFFRTATLFTEVEGSSKGCIKWKGGLEIFLKKEASLLLGLHSQPFCITTGIAVCLAGIPLVFTTLWCPNSGFHPSSSLSYEW